MDITPKVEFEFDGFLNGWTDVTPDVVIEEGIRWDRGLPGDGQRDRVAKTGVLSFSLDNSEQNSLGEPGAYTFGHANQRDGFIKTVGARFSLVIGAETIIVFTGRLRYATPSVGQVVPPKSFCLVSDYQYQLAKKSLGALEIQQDILDSDVFAMLIEAMPVQPRAVGITSGFDTLPIVFHNMDQKAKAATELHKLCETTQALQFTRADGTVVYEPRSIRARNNTNNVLTITEDDLPRGDNLDVVDDADDVVNVVRATVHPPTLETSDVVLFSLAGVVQIQSGTIPIRGLYTEPGLRARRAGGLDMLPAEPGVDYVFNTAADGSGLDVTADVEVETTFTAGSVIFLITAPVACWILTLQARGIGAYDNANVVMEATDQDSIDENGENPLEIDLPLSGDINFADELAQYRLSLAQQNAKRVRSARFELEGLSTERAAQIARREISDRIAFSEFMNALPTSTASGFNINAMSGEVDGSGRTTVKWVMAASDSTAYWYLGIVGRSELGLTTRLGFSLIVGHTDAAHSDAHGDSAHSDVAHADTHSDVAHEDAAHADSAHSDVAHSDVAHSDVAHTDFHVDSHDDVWFDDSHGDSAHGDAHNDFFDGAHGDGHIDNAHNDSHVDIPHSDFHGDLAHNDVAHSDASHSDVAHSDAGHADAAHADTAHTDTHTDTLHQDVGHADDHGDVEHGDVNGWFFWFVITASQTAHWIVSGLA